MLHRLWLWILKLLGYRRGEPAAGDRRTAQYALKIFESRPAAREAAKRDGVAALVGTEGKPKWLILKCPCGCGQEIALNLMGSHLPRWRVEVGASQQFSVHPSVDATSCGAHFWLRNGKVNWCD